MSERQLRLLIREQLAAVEPVPPATQSPAGQALEPTVNTKKSVADAFDDLITVDPRFIFGRRKDVTNRIYPVTQPAPPLEDFKNFIEDNIVTGTPPGQLVVVPPGRHMWGYKNKSGRFDLVLVVPGGGKFDHEDYTQGEAIPTMLAGGPGASAGQKFEDDLTAALKATATTPINVWPPLVVQTLEKIGIVPASMAGAQVKQTKPKKRPLRPEPYDVGQLIADIIITGASTNPVYISVKNKDGSTFGNFGYGGFEMAERRSGSKFVRDVVDPKDVLTEALGIDKKFAVRGLNNRLKGITTTPQRIRTKRNFNADVIQGYLASGIGFGYWYIREASTGIKCYHVKDADSAYAFIGTVNGVKLRYPQGEESKQITATVTTSTGKFTIEYRNTGGGFLPNQVNFKVNTVTAPPSLACESIMKNKGTLIRAVIRESLLLEELTKSDKKEIERIARKQVQRDLIDKKEIEKIARKEVEAEIKKALGVSFMGHKGKINKFVIDEIQKEVQKWLKDRATKQEVADITKEVMIKVYRALSFSYRPLIDRIRI